MRIRRHTRYGGVAVGKKNNANINSESGQFEVAITIAVVKMSDEYVIICYDMYNT